MQFVIEELKNSILKQAIYFLREAGEFYPFASVADKNNAISPVGVYWGKEYPAASDVILELEKGLREGLKSRKYKGVAIGCDVFIHSDRYPGERMSAIQIRIATVEGVRVNYYFPYTINDSNEIIMENHREEEGTLILT